MINISICRLTLKYYKPFQFKTKLINTKFTFQEKFRKLLDKPLKTLGFVENTMDNDFIKCLREEIVKWACTLDHPECTNVAHQKLLYYLWNPEKYP